MSWAKVIFKKSLQGPSAFVQMLEVTETATERGFLGESIFFGETTYGGKHLVVSRADQETDWTAIVSSEFIEQCASEQQAQLQTD